MSVEMSLKEAAEAVGKDPSTLSRAVKSGRLSCGKDSSGQRVFDPAELMRVYGVLNLQDDAEVVRTSTGARVRTSESEAVDVVLEARVRELESENPHLRARVRDLEGRVDDLKEQRDRWQRESMDWKEQAKVQTRLLTDERERYEETEKVLEEQGRMKPSKLPQFAAIAALLVASAGAFTILYPEEVREFSMLETAPEMEIEPEVASIETEREAVTVPDAPVTHESVVFPSLLSPIE